MRNELKWGPKNEPKVRTREFSSLLKEKFSALVTIQAALQVPRGLKNYWREITG